MTQMVKIFTDRCFDVLDFMVGVRRCPVWFHGPSGVGKTEIQKAWAKHRAKQLGLIYFEPKFDPATGGLTAIPEGADPHDYFGDVDFRAILHDVLDVKGAAYLDKEGGFTRFLPPSILPNVHKHGWTGVFRLDEIAQAFAAVSNSLTQLVSERKVGDSYAFPDDWDFLATGNRKEDHAATQRAGSQVYNRFDHFEIVPKAESLARHLRRRGGDHRISSFVAYKQELMHSYEKGDIVFPSPRKWEETAQTVEDAIKANLSKDDMQMMIASHVGTGPAAEVVGFLDICNDLVSYKQVIDDPKRCPTPDTTGSGGTATTFAMMNLLLRRVTEDDMDAVMTYVDRLPELMQSTFALDLKDMAENEIEQAKDNPATPVQYRFLVQTPAFTKWRARHPISGV